MPDVRRADHIGHPGLVLQAEETTPRAVPGRCRCVTGPPTTTPPPDGAVVRLEAGDTPCSASISRMCSIGLRAAVRPPR